MIHVLSKRSFLEEIDAFEFETEVGDALLLATLEKVQPRARPQSRNLTHEERTSLMRKEPREKPTPQAPQEVTGVRPWPAPPPARLPPYLHTAAPYSSELYLRTAARTYRFGGTAERERLTVSTSLFRVTN